MQYTSSRTLAGSPESALRVVREALVANGFAIVEASPTEVTAIGPGMFDSRQNPLHGVSKAKFRAEDGVIRAQAELGGAVWLGRFAMFFPLGLGLLLAMLFGLMGLKPGRPGSPSSPVLIPLIAVSPWLVLGPLLGRFIRKRTEKAVEALVQSAATISRLG